MTPAVFPSLLNTSSGLEAKRAAYSGMNARTLHLSKGTAINPADDSSNKPAMNPLHKPTEKPMTVAPPDEAKELSLPATMPKENKRNQFPNLNLAIRGAT